MSDSPGLVDFAIFFSSVLVLIKNICTTSFFTDKVASVSYMCWRCNSVSFSPSKLLNSFYTTANLQLSRCFPFEWITDRFQLRILAFKTKFSLHANLPFSFSSGRQKNATYALQQRPKSKTRQLNKAKMKKKERKKEVEIFTTGYQGQSINHLLTLPIEAFFKKPDQRQVL